MTPEPVSTRRALAVLLACAVGLAGCGGLGGGDGGDPTAAPTGQAPTSVPTTAPGTGTAAGGDLDAAAVATAHAETLGEAESFASRILLRQTAGSNTTTVVDRYRVDRSADRALRRSNLTRVRGETSQSLLTDSYTAGSVTLVRTVSGGITQYDRATEPYEDAVLVTPVNETLATFAPQLGELDALNWTAVGTETVAGTEVTRYEADGVEDFPDVGSGPGSRIETVREATAVLLVGEDGVVRRLSYDVRGENDDGRSVTLTIDLRILDVGDVTVEEPAWADAARNRTDGTTTA